MTEERVMCIEQLAARLHSVAKHYDLCSAYTFGTGVGRGIAMYGTDAHTPQTDEEWVGWLLAHIWYE